MSPTLPSYLFASRPLWAAIFWGSFVAFNFVGWWAHARERSRAKGESRDRGSYRTLMMASMLGFVGIFAAPAFFPQIGIPLPGETVFAGGAVILWAGILLYVWSVRTLGEFFRTQVQLLEGQKLVTKGPYRILRHPAYLGGILIFTGLGAMTGNAVSTMLAPVVVGLGYAFRIHVEEIALRERFGAAFDEHRKRTWAVIPLIW